MPALRIGESARNGITSRMAARLASQRSELLQQRPSLESELKRIWPLPDWGPPYREVLVSDDGCMWFEFTRLNWPTIESLIEYDIRSLSGEGRGSVTVPGEVRLLNVTCRDGIGVVRDSDDVPELVRVAR